MMDRKKIILASLLIIFAIFFVYRLTHPFKQEKLDQLTYTNEDRRRKVTVKIDTLPETNYKPSNFHTIFSKFLNPPALSGDVVKNPFYQKKELPEIEKKNDMEEIDKEEPAGMKDPLVQVNKELSQFKVLGSFESEGEKAIFLGRGREMMVVRVGDRIDGKYLIQNISDASVTLKAENINETVHIDMSEF